MNETLEQIALRVASQIDSFIWCEGSLNEGGVLDHQAVEFARRLVAALGAQEPVAWMDETRSALTNEIECVKEYPSANWQPLYAAPYIKEVWRMVPIAMVEETCPCLCQWSEDHSAAMLAAAPEYKP